MASGPGPARPGTSAPGGGDGPGGARFDQTIGTDGTSQAGRNDKAVGVSGPQRVRGPEAFGDVRADGGERVKRGGAVGRAGGKRVNRGGAVGRAGGERVKRGGAIGSAAGERVNWGEAVGV